MNERISIVGHTTNLVDLINGEKTGEPYYEVSIRMRVKDHGIVLGVLSSIAVMVSHTNALNPCPSPAVPVEVPPRIGKEALEDLKAVNSPTTSEPIAEPTPERKTRTRAAKVVSEASPEMEAQAKKNFEAASAKVETVASKTVTEDDALLKDEEPPQEQQPYPMENATTPLVEAKVEPKDLGPKSSSNLNMDVIRKATKLVEIFKHAIECGNKTIDTCFEAVNAVKDENAILTRTPSLKQRVKQHFEVFGVD